MDIAITLEPEADTGWAVRRNGTLLLRTATETDWQAMGNGLVLIFNADVYQIDWAAPGPIRKAWEHCLAQSHDELEIVRCRVVMMEPGL